MQGYPLFTDLNISNLLKISGMDFEDLCLKLYRYKYSQYHVQKTNINDFGADLLVNFDYGRKMVVQCKTSQKGSAIGVKAIQEVIASKENYGAEFSTVLTNTLFTLPATKLAGISNVSLVTGRELVYQFSTTKFEIEDIPFLYDSLYNAILGKKYSYINEYLSSPNKVFDISSLELIHLVSLITKNVRPGEMLDISEELSNGIRYIFFLCFDRLKNVDM